MTTMMMTKMMTMTTLTTIKMTTKVMMTRTMITMPVMMTTMRTMNTEFIWHIWFVGCPCPAPVPIYKVKSGALPSISVSDIEDDSWHEVHVMQYMSWRRRWFMTFSIYNVENQSINVSNMQIWKCPEFNILNCKTPPADCLSFDMIYLRHGDLECPGCVICADPSHYDPWPAEVLRAGELRRRRVSYMNNVALVW